MATTRRFVFKQDNDAHWYMIPEDKREEFDRLMEIPDMWELPEWNEFENYRLDGGIENISFTSPLELIFTE